MPKPPCTHARRFFICNEWLITGPCLGSGSEFISAFLGQPVGPAAGTLWEPAEPKVFHARHQHRHRPTTPRDISNKLHTSLHPCETHPMLKLHAGVSRKVGLPGYSSASASCTIEAELDSSLLQDRAGFQLVVQRAYQSCEQAVQDQIARLTQDDTPGETVSIQPAVAHEPVAEVRTSPLIQGARVSASIPARTVPPTILTTETQPSPRPATTSQVRAIRAICSRRKIDLVTLLRDRYGIQTADELGIRQASTLIDELKSDEGTSGPSTSNVSGNGAGNHAGAYAVNGGAR